jgi:hypothetical protein
MLSLRAFLLNSQLPPLDLHCVLIIRALVETRQPSPVQQNHLAKMAVLGSSSIKLAVKRSFRHQR